MVEVNKHRPKVLTWRTRLPTVDEVERFMTGRNITFPEEVRQPSWRGHTKSRVVTFLFVLYKEDHITFADLEPIQRDMLCAPATPFDIVAIARASRMEPIFNIKVVGLGELIALDPPPSEYRYALSADLSASPVQSMFSWVSGPQGWDGTDTWFAFVKP